MGADVSLLSCFSIAFNCLTQVFPNSFSHHQGIAEAILPRRRSLLGSLSEQLHSLCRVLRNAFAISIHAAKYSLRVGIALFSRHAIPIRCRCKIFWGTLPS